MTFDKKGLPKMQVICQVVKIWESEVEIKIYHKSKSVWIARGEYLGVSYEGKGSSPNTAANSWREQARYANN